MDGVIGLIVLVVIIIATLYFVNRVTVNFDNSKFRTLLKVLACFIMTEIFFMSLPLVGVGVDSLEEYAERIGDLFSEPIFVLIGLVYVISILYLAIGAYFIADVKKVKRKIQLCEQEINDLEQEIQNRKNIVHLLLLLDQCNADISDLKNNAQIKKIALLENKIQQKHKEIRMLAEKLGN